MPACKACGLMLGPTPVCEDCGQDQRDPVYHYTGLDLGPEDPPEDPETFPDDEADDEEEYRRYGKFGPRD